MSESGRPFLYQAEADEIVKAVDDDFQRNALSAVLSGLILEPSWSNGENLPRHDVDLRYVMQCMKRMIVDTDLLQKTLSGEHQGWWQD